MKKAKKIIKMTLVVLSIAIILLAAVTAGVNFYVTGKTGGRIVGPEELTSVAGDGFDAVIVLGCSVLPDGSPSHMLADRIDAGVEAFNASGARLLVMSGDRKENYDEVGTMVARAVSAGVDPSLVAEDPEGFSTYESMLRAAKNFGFRRIIVVSQRYHLYRALYIAGQLGMEAYGVGADPRAYSGQLMRDIRETAARVKDFFKTFAVH